MKFTDKYITSLKPKAKDYRVREGHGFAVRVLPSGVKRFEFIYTIGGKRRIMHLGNYPAVALAEARIKYNEAAALLARGTDPQQQPSPEKPVVPPEQLTVTGLHELWTKWSEQHHSAKWANTLKLALEKDILPTYGQHLACEIRRRDAVAILEQKAATAPGQAVNLHKALRGMFQYAVERELVEYNPFSEIRAARTIPTMKQTARERILSDDEIKYLWTAINQGGGSDSTQRALKLMLVTRRSGKMKATPQRFFPVEQSISFSSPLQSNFFPAFDLRFFSIICSPLISLIASSSVSGARPNFSKSVRQRMKLQSQGSPSGT